MAGGGSEQSNEHFGYQGTITVGAGHECVFHASNSVKARSLRSHSYDSVTQGKAEVKPSNFPLLSLYHGIVPGQVRLSREFAVGKSTPLCTSYIC